MKQRQCLICNSTKSYLRKYRSGTVAESWHRYEDGWRCQPCYYREYYIKNPEKIRMIRYNSHTRTREHHRQRVKEIKIEKRLQLFEILGRTCVKCGYSTDLRALTFDHVRDDGEEDRKLHHNDSRAFYTFYIKNPDIAKANLQILCWNCNAIKKCELMNYKL